jgi:hypothetical protein
MGETQARRKIQKETQSGDCVRNRERMCVCVCESGCVGMWVCGYAGVCTCAGVRVCVWVLRQEFLTEG